MYTRHAPGAGRPRTGGRESPVEQGREFAAQHRRISLVMKRPDAAQIKFDNVRKSYTMVAPITKKSRQTMRISAILKTVVLLCGASTALAQVRPVHTFSIVARDPATGEMGAAVQSHWFSVGSTVIWGEAGVGVVATQSFVDPSYGPLGLALMKAGRTAGRNPCSPTISR